MSGHSLLNGGSAQDAWSDAMDAYFAAMSESVGVNPPRRVSLEKRAAAAPLLSLKQAAATRRHWRSLVRPSAENASRTILSLFDSTGEWSRPYREAGFNVVQIDMNITGGYGAEMDVLEIDQEWLCDHGLDMVFGILAACPCTEFAGSGARWFAAKDADGRTERARDLVHHTLAIIEFLAPDAFWVIENPVGRIKDVTSIPVEFLQFQPHNFGDPYTKRTQLFGRFNPDLPMANVRPSRGSFSHQLRGNVPAEKALRSQTFAGFAYAFYLANHELPAVFKQEE